MHWAASPSASPRPGPAAPAAVNLASAPVWEEARRRVHATVTGRLAEAAGAHVTWQHDAERMTAPDPAAPMTAGPVVAGPDPAASVTAGLVTAGPVAAAVAYAGADAITYALARL